jgi:hypothetical protein
MTGALRKLRALFYKPLILLYLQNLKSDFMISLLDRVRQSLAWKKNAQFCADRLGIALEDYLILKSQLISPEEETKKGIISTEMNFQNNTQRIEAISFTEPKSAEEIIELLNIDTTKWKLSQYWNKQKKDHWVVSALVTAVKQTQQDVLAEVLKNFSPKKVSVYVHNLVDTPSAVKNYCGVFSVQDIHFGKDGNEEVISDFKNAVIDVTSRVSKMHMLDKLIYVIGGDLLNADTFDGTTTSGTPVSNGMNPVDAYAEAFEALYWAIYQMSAITSDLQVVYVPGNHDRLSSYHLAHALSKAIELPNVTFAVDYLERKVVTWGDNFFAFEHGDVNTKNSPMVYAFEFPTEWGKTKFRTLYTGHYHMKRTSSYITEDEINGFTIKIMPSLSRTDYWHYHNKFVGSKRAAIMDIHEMFLGKAGEICHIA